MGTKPFKSYEEQVSILQSRGLGIDDPGYRRKRGALDGVSWV